MTRPILFLLIILNVSSVISQHIALKNWKFYTELDSVSKTIELPHTWNLLDAFDDESGYWRGKGYYLTDINIADLDKKYYLHFNGANQETNVWINNKEAGNHKGGYTAFDIGITQYLVLGKNSIKVEVDNGHNETIPPLDADFTFYGGIYRNVYLVQENPTHFKKIYGADAIKVDAILDENRQGKLQIRGSVYSEIQNSEYKIKLKLKGHENEEILSIEEDISENFNLNLEVKDPFLWSPENPNLYNLELQLFQDDNLEDIFIHKLGFRNFKASASGFELNGKPLKLIGVNRHQDWQGYGNAVPIINQIQDLVMIKDMGSNFLRLAHYPQDKAIYKAADSLGLILWSEIPVVNKVPASLDYELYKENSLQMQLEHITQNYNHPSLIFIGYMNEIFLRMVFDKPVKELEQKIIANTLELAADLEKLTRKEATNHITVMALHGNQVYNDTGISNLPMVIGWNLYYGWYEGEINDLGRFLDIEHQKYPNKPLIISEYGVGADIRIHNSNPTRFDFTEEYQFEYHTGYYHQIMKRPFVIGMSAWNFADFGSEFRGDAMPHINQKGLVNFDRTPKNIYYWYKAILRPEEKLSRIFRDIPKQINNTSVLDVKFLSNQIVHFYLNNNEALTLKPDNGIIDHTINLDLGINTLQLFDDTGNYQDSLKIVYENPDFNQNSSLAINFGTNSYFIDNSNRIWVPLKNLSNIKVTGEYSKVFSSTNIMNTLDDPIYQSLLNDVNAINIELPKGKYELTLLFSNLNKKKNQTNEIGQKRIKANRIKKDPSLIINNKIIRIDEMESFSKQDIVLTVEIDKNLLIKSVKNELFSICGLIIRKL